jgi:hypothetical protein
LISRRLGPGLIAGSSHHTIIANLGHDQWRDHHFRSNLHALETQSARAGEHSDIWQMTVLNFSRASAPS